MTITDEQREQAYKNATERQLYLYEDQESARSLDTISQTHPFLDQVYTDFLIAVGDVILGLVPQEQLPQLLIERLQITQAEAMRITADVLDFLEPLNKPLTSTQNPGTPVEINVDAQSNSEDTLAAELAETEAAFKQLQPIRTMAHDMETIRSDEEPVHQATDQETILNGQGNAEKNTEAQWGTPEK